MKKTFTLVLMLSFLTAVFAQRDVVSEGKSVLVDPAVTVTITNVTESSFTASFTPNAECSRYEYLAMNDQEIMIWTALMPVENLITTWGISAVGPDTHTWEEMLPNMTYKIFVKPYDNGSTPYPYTYIEVTTLEQGGVGTSCISISVSEITDSTARVICTPNDETASFFDGLVTTELLDEIGLDSAKTIIRSNPTNIHYTTDDWVWPSLSSGTGYTVIAFGLNAAGEWGPDSTLAFTTLSAGVGNYETHHIVLYPVPVNGPLHIAGSDLAGCRAQIFSINGQLISEKTLEADDTVVTDKLSAGVYVLRVVDAQGTALGQKKIVVE